MSVQSHNAPYFGFLRRRQEFVDMHSLHEEIEGFVLWGATVDALAQIHTRRVSPGMKGNRKRLVQALLDLAPSHALSTPSVPLLAHDLANLEVNLAAARSILETPPFKSYADAQSTSRMWSASEDKSFSGELDRIRALHCTCIDKLFTSNRYADVLYEEYRCCAVHGLELGRKTCPPFGTSLTEPGYMKYCYGNDDDRPEKYRYGTRIAFPLAYLARLLAEMISKEEQQCLASTWAIPSYPTLDAS